MKMSYLERAEDVLESLGLDLDGARARAPLPDLGTSALVLLDLQRLFVDPASPAFLPSWPAIEDRVRTLVRAYSRAGRPVVWTRHVHPPTDRGGTIGRLFGRLIHDGDPLSDLAAGWDPGPGDIVIAKPRHSAFARTDLANLLADRGVTTVVLAGVQAHLCVLATAVEAGSSDLMPVVALDAIVAPDLDLHRASLRALSGGLAWIASTREIVHALEEVRW